MKRFILAGALLAATSMVSFAQAPSAVAAKNAETAAKASEKALSLSKEQYDAAYKAELMYYQQDEVARAHGGPGAGQAMQMAMARDQQYRRVLNTTQWTKYQTTHPKPGMAQPASQMAH